MDPMEKMDPESKEWGYIGRKFFAQKMWAPTAARSFLAAQLKSLQEFLPRQGADTLSLKKAIDSAMDKWTIRAGLPTKSYSTATFETNSSEVAALGRAIARSASPGRSGGRQSQKRTRRSTTRMSVKCHNTPLFLIKARRDTAQRGVLTPGAF